MIFDAKDIIHKDFVPLGQTVNAAYYVNILEMAATWVLHQDKASCHISLAKCHLATSLHSPYRLDCVPVDLFLFPRFGTCLTDRRFGGIDTIQTTVTTAPNKDPVEASRSP